MIPVIFLTEEQLTFSFECKWISELKEANFRRPLDVENIPE